MTSSAGALSGHVGIEYNSLREGINWEVGLNTDIEENFNVGFTLENWTTAPQRSVAPPYIGFAPMSVYYGWHIEYTFEENTKLYVERFCEHWMAQSPNYDDYVGIKYGVKYEF